MLNKLIKFFLWNKLVTLLLLVLFVCWGLATAPFNWNIKFLPRDPIPVDAIPDIGENQQIVFTEWMGKSPQDVENQITYPLTTALLGLPGVTSVRSTSMFGLSFIAIIFNENIDYYWSRTRVLEKLNSLSSKTLPQGVTPTLGPDATALGQVFWYTLEGRDDKGKPVGGWDLHELRSLQDFYVKYGLSAAEGVSEVASIGGFVKEYQVDLDPAALKTHEITMMMVMEAIRNSNTDIGANTIEMNLVEYYIRSLGFIKNIQNIEQAVVKVVNNIPIRIKDIAKVNIGPAPRGHSGFLDKDGVAAVGGVVIARYGDNPLKVVQNIKDKIKEISPGLPTKQLENGGTSKVTIIPFYDRSKLIYETLGTLNESIGLQILITILVIIVMVYHLRTSLMISALLPLAVLMSFIMMKLLRVDANIVALSGIAIAIGTMVDLGIILSENILRQKDKAPPDQPLITTIYNASAEVSSAILTAVATTIVSFLPVFTLTSAEGKLFGPLAYTKTFALLSALTFTFIMMPAFAHCLFAFDIKASRHRLILNGILIFFGIFALWWSIWAGIILVLLGLNNVISYYAKKQAFSSSRLNQFFDQQQNTIANSIITIAVSYLMAKEWSPLGIENGLTLNFLFVVFIAGGILGSFKLFIRYYPFILSLCLEYKKVFLMIPLLTILFAINIWLGTDKVFGIIPKLTDQVGWNIRTTSVWSSLTHAFPGLKKEFMPSLDEGSFLLMPTSMPHSGIEANTQYLQQLDMRVQAIPEVESVVGKAGRVDSALDPAPVSMFENMITYKTEYINDNNGYPIRFKVDKDGNFLKDDQGQLIPNKQGRYFRQWRDHIKSPDDIWDEITEATKDIPGVTSAPKLQPIETRLVMLQTGMRAPIGLKIFGPDLKSIEEFSLKVEQYLKKVNSVKEEAVFADRSLGKPYIEIDIDRIAIARYGLNIADVQMVLEVALGGMPLTTTIEGRERYNIRARYAREWRDNPEAMKEILISTPTGQNIPLGELATIDYRPGPMMIRGENSFLVTYVLLDKKEGYSEVTVVEDAKNYLNEKIASGELIVPAGVSYLFSGNFENQIRAEKRLVVILPMTLLAIFLILFFQFRSIATSLMVFTGVALAFAGGIIMLWLYGTNWFMDFSVFEINMRELFQMKTYNLSVAVWVGFIALFGIATDDGVVISTYLTQNFKEHSFYSVKEVREAVMDAGMKRLRPCLMTTATTLLALLPILTSKGRGSDIMIPMAIPAFGGMLVALVTLFIVPVLFSLNEEHKIIRGSK